MDELGADAGGPAEKKGGLPVGKIAMGCLAVLLVICGVGGYFVYQFVVVGKQMAVAIIEIQGQEGSEVARLLGEAAAAAPFDEPAEPTTTAERLEVFLTTREGVYASAKAAHDAQKEFDPESDMGLMEGAKLLATAFDAWAETRKDFGRALVANGISADEYTYLHRLCFHSGIVEGAILEGPENVIELEGLEGVSEETKEVVLPFEERIQAQPSGEVDRYLLGLGTEKFTQGAGR